jgi:hypothetical protein
MNTPGQVTPLHASTQVPVPPPASHFCPAGQVTPWQAPTQVPLAPSHFCTAEQVTMVQVLTQLPFWQVSPGGQLTP